MEIIGQLVSDVVKCLVDPLFKHIGYTRNLKRKLEELNEKSSDLYNKRSDVTDEINRNKEEKIPKHECKGWLDQVEKIEKEVNTIKDEYNGAKKWFNGCCLNIKARWKVGKHMAEISNKTNDLLAKSKFEGEFLADAPPKIVTEIPLPNTLVQKPICRTSEKVLGYMRNVGIKRIGIWGMGGVGKTTIMKSLNNLQEMTSMFDIVIWVTVSKERVIRQIQNEVSRCLKLDIKNEEPDESVAKILFGKLKHKKYLLLLDDVWNKVELEKVGIPDPIEGDGCKILLTTRSLGVCNEMRTDKDINVPILSGDEAWELFSTNVGAVVSEKSIKPLAKDIIRECGGLPLLINVIGATLRKENDIYIWRDLLNDLRSPATSHDDKLNEFVFKVLKVSYDRLEGAHTKECFLYCALYPEDHYIRISNVVKYWWEEGLIDARSLAQGIDKGHRTLKTLKEASLLESCEGDDEYVKMHDVIRDLALIITSSDKNEEGCSCLVRAGLNTEETPMENEWKFVEKISLMYNKLTELPESPQCGPKLSTLLLQQNKGLKRIPEFFFKYMNGLRVLDLSDTGITFLPSSLSNLVNLRALHLRRCEDLVTLPSSVGSLEQLAVLDVWVKAVPREIGNLTSLRSLKVHLLKPEFEEQEEVVIPSGMLSGLSELEELSITRVGLDQLSQYDEWVEVVRKDLTSLKKLFSLVFHFGKTENLQHFIHNNQSWRNGHLRTFAFYVGRAIDYDMVEGVRGFYYEGDDDGNTSITIPVEIMDVVKNADRFILRRHKRLKYLSEFGVENLERLKYCKVEYCEEMKGMIDAGNDVRSELVGVLSNLETLYLKSLSQLSSVWVGKMPSVGSFSSLRQLYIDHCERIKWVFPITMIQQLSNLEDLNISWCREMEAIFDAEEKDGIVYELPKLKLLHLLFVRKLDRIGTGGGVLLSCPSLQELRIIGCPISESLIVNTPPNLRPWVLEVVSENNIY